MNESLFSVGDRVVVSYMGAEVVGTVERVVLRSRNGHVYEDPYYVLRIDGALGKPNYRHSEVTAE